MLKIRKKSSVKKTSIYDEIKVAKEEGDIESLEEIDEEQEDESLLDFDPDDRDYDSIKLDPISVFVMSDDEDKEDNKLIELKPNLEVEVHAADMSSPDEERLKIIWDKPAASKIRGNLSQNTLDGIRGYFQMLECIENLAVPIPRKSSVPSIEKPNRLPPSSDFSSLPSDFTLADCPDSKVAVIKPVPMTPKMPEETRLPVIAEEKQDDPIQQTEKSTVIQKSYEEIDYKMSKVCTIQGGRYSLLNRDFSPKNPPKSNGCPEFGDEVDLGPSRDSSDSDESTDTLLEEARQFVSIAKRKLVTLDDWKLIESRCKK